MIKDFRKARNAGVPLIGIRSVDADATLKRIVDAEGGRPVVRWDCVTGWTAANDAGLTAIRLALGEVDEDEIKKRSINVVEQLLNARALPEDTVLVLVQPQRYLAPTSNFVAGFIQALLNVRDPFKANGRAVVLLGTELSLPVELTEHFIILDDELPTSEELRALVTTTCEANEVDIEKVDMERAVDALKGLGEFSAEQALAMELRRDGVDLDGLFRRKCQMVDETDGLSVYKPEGGFDDMAGNEVFKEYVRELARGRKPIKVVAFIDEGDKAFAGAVGSGDNTGVSQGFLGTILKEMEDRQSSGMILVGPAGGGKSAAAKSIGKEAGCLTVAFDLAGMKTSLLGSSEARLKRALATLKAIGDGSVFYVMTCNRIAALPPELKRRYKAGTFYFDIPSNTERLAIFKLYCDKLGLDYSQVAEVDHTDWTGAEIKQCCETAWNLNWTLRQASRFIVPVAKSGAQELEALRQQADGVFLSASYEGVYRRRQPEVVKGRKVAL